jgi:phage terminase Nu1 subunit (DNA packaging protein)
MKEKALAEWFHVSSKTIRRWTQRGMPRVREGAVVLYAVEDCEAWLRSRAKPIHPPGAPPQRRIGRRRRNVAL